VDRSGQAKLRHDEADALSVRAGMPACCRCCPRGRCPGAARRQSGPRGGPDPPEGRGRIAETQAKDVQIGQLASIDTRNGLVAGGFAGRPLVQNGTVTVDARWTRASQGARPTSASTHHRTRAGSTTSSSSSSGLRQEHSTGASSSSMPTVSLRSAPSTTRPQLRQHHRDRARPQTRRPVILST